MRVYGPLNTHTHAHTIQMQATQAFTARQRTLTDVRTRVHTHVGTWLNDHECIQVALCASLREAEEATEFLFRKEVAKATLEKKRQLALNLHEWDALFGAPAVATNPASVERLAADGEFKSMLERLGTALRCTTEEKELKQTWGRGWTKAACVIAMHTDSHEDLVASSVGSVVRADSRRLEELRNEIDDDEAETMMLSSAIVALSQAIV